ncbi:MAG TPA: hypothetical protein VFP68_01860 [Burkholderiaceae bacterium]|nr:hypothetical protein [Burkholderiaceae bacterium]
MSDDDAGAYRDELPASPRLCEPAETGLEDWRDGNELASVEARDVLASDGCRLPPPRLPDARENVAPLTLGVRARVVPILEPEDDILKGLKKNGRRLLERTGIAPFAVSANSCAGMRSAFFRCRQAFSDSNGATRRKMVDVLDALANQCATRPHADTAGVPRRAP